MSKTKTKKLTKRQREQIEKAIRKNLNEAFKRNNIILETKLKETQEIIDDLTTDSNIYEHRNSIFIPTLDEATGEKTYKARNFDEVLKEYENTETINDLARYDRFQEMLDESLEYEWNTYHTDEEEDLSELDIKQTAKDLGQKARDKVKGAIETGKETWKKGKLIFFFKVLETGLKIAVKVSTLAKETLIGLVKRFVKKIVAAWIKTRAEASELWAKFKESIGNQMGKIVGKVIQPFLSIATKMTGGNAEKAAYLAPILLNITVLSLTLAIMYAFATFDIFRTGAGEMITSVQSACGGEMAESKNNNTLLEAPFSCGDLLDDFVPGGEKVTNETCNAVYDQLKNNIQGEVMSAMNSGVGIDVEDSPALEAWNVLQAKADSLIHSGSGPMVNQANSLAQQISPEAEKIIKDAVNHSAKHAAYMGEHASEEFKAGFSGIDMGGVMRNAMEAGSTRDAFHSMKGDIENMLQVGAKHVEQLTGEGSVFEDVLNKAWEMPNGMDKMIERYGPYGKQIAKIMDLKSFSTVGDMLEDLKDEIKGNKYTGSEGLEGVDAIKHIADHNKGSVGLAAKRLISDLEKVGVKESKISNLGESQLKRLKKLAGIV